MSCIATIGSVGDVLGGSASCALVHGDNREAIKGIPDASIDFVVADPCYAIGPRDPTPDEIIAYLNGSGLDTGGDFMGRKDWTLPTVSLWREHYRVLKPGAHLAVFCGPQTADLMSMAIRLAGFERRDDVPIYGSAAWNWIQGQGMKKGLDVSKAIDEAAGAEREVVGNQVRPDGTSRDADAWSAGMGYQGNDATARNITAPASPEAQRWDGFETDLASRHEGILLYRKPLDFAAYVVMISSCVSRLIARLAESRSWSTSASGDEGTEGSAAGPVASALAGAKAQRTDTSIMGGSSATEATCTSTSETAYAFWSTVMSWRSTLEDLCSLERSFTTETRSSLTTDLKTLSSLITQLTERSTAETGQGSSADGPSTLASSVDAFFNVVSSRLALIRTLSATEPASTQTGGGICRPENARPSHESILIFRKPIATVTSEQLRAATGWAHWHVVADFRKPEARAKACAKWGVADPGGDLQERDVRALEPEAESWRELRWREKGGQWVVIKSTEPRPYKAWTICNVAANVLVYGTGAISIDRCRTYTDWSDRPDSWKRSGHSAKPDAEKIAAPPGTGINCHPAGRHPANCFFLHDRRCQRVGERAIKGTARPGPNAGWIQPGTYRGMVGLDAGHMEARSYTGKDGTEPIQAYSCLCGCRACGREWTAPSGGKAPACECGAPGQWRRAVARLDAQAGKSENGYSRFFPTFDYDEDSWSPSQNGERGETSQNGTGVGTGSGESLEAGRSSANPRADGCGKFSEDRFLLDTRSTTSTTTEPTTGSRICSALQSSGTTITTVGIEKTTPRSTELSSDDVPSVESASRSMPFTCDEQGRSTGTARSALRHPSESGELRTASNTYNTSATGTTSTGNARLRDLDWAEEPDPFCYASKASRAERDAGLDHRNTHVAVKPQKVLEYLVRLVGAPGAVGLTAWAGSGSEVAAMVSQGCRAIGIEWDAVHHADAVQRVPALVRGERRRAPDPKREPPKPPPVKAQPQPAVQQLSFL